MNGDWGRRRSQSERHHRVKAQREGPGLCLRRRTLGRITQGSRIQSTLRRTFASHAVLI